MRVSPDVIGLSVGNSGLLGVIYNLSVMIKMLLDIEWKGQ